MKVKITLIQHYFEKEKKDVPEPNHIVDFNELDNYRKAIRAKHNLKGEIYLTMHEINNQPVT
jgi:hypothetical protein